MGGGAGTVRRLAFQARGECATVIKGRELEMFHDLPQHRKILSTVTIHSPAAELTFQIFFCACSKNTSHYSHYTQPRCRADFPESFFLCLQFDLGKVELK